MNGIIFDMDGVLFPTEGLKFKAYAQVFKNEYGLELQDTPKRLGLSETKAMELFLEILGRPEESGDIPKLTELKREAYYKILDQENFQAYEGVENFLQQLKDSGEFKIGLATSSNRKSTDILLDRFDFRRFFETVICVEDVKEPKPSPETYLLAATKLGLKPDSCLVFEDSPAGIEAAKSAGMKCAAITNGVGEDQLNKADMVIDSFNQLDIKRIQELLK